MPTKQNQEDIFHNSKLDCYWLDWRIREIASLASQRTCNNNQRNSKKNGTAIGRKCIAIYHDKDSKILNDYLKQRNGL